MLKRISHIKNFGVFLNYKRTGNIEDFKELNIIYGWNYSGKTTIARLFNCLNKKELHKDYTNCEFEVIDENNKKFSESNLNNIEKVIRVFNSDFIQNNLKWDGKAIDPILLLGEESIEAEKQIKEKNGKIEKINSIVSKLTETQTGLNNEIEMGLTNKASEIKNKLNLVETFTKTHLKSILQNVRNNHSSFLVNDTKEIQKLLKEATVSEEDKLPEINKYNPSLFLSSLISEVEELVKQVPELSKTIDYFLKNPEVATWVEKGIPIHKNKNECEYCGNTIGTDRKDALLAHFSDDLNNHKAQLNKLKENILNAKLKETTEVKTNFYPVFRDEFELASKNINASINQYNKQLDKLLEILQVKHDKPFESISNTTSINDCSEDTSSHIKAYVDIIDKNNLNTNEFIKNKLAAIKKLKEHYTAKFINEINLYNKESKISLYQKRQQKLLESKNEVEKLIKEIEAKISNAQKGREKLNEYIHSFLGHKEIKIDVEKIEDNEIFILKRGQLKALNLSEGEKTAVAFSFFLTKLLEIEDLKKAIIYIDDPISSLDSNHIFQVNALLKKIFFYKKSENDKWELTCKQLFLSTHNFEFLGLLNNLPLGKQFTNYYHVRRFNKTESNFENLPKAIRNYTSEYHYLFNEIYKYHNSDNKNDFEALMNIPNSVRRFVELYTYSKIPSNRSTTVDERTDKLFGHEKSKRIMKVLHYFSHSNNIERMTKNSDLLCDIENAVDDLITELKKDKLHFDELMKSIQ